jgi:FdhE protein
LVNQEGHAVHVSAMDEGGVSLETCDACSHYLKIVNMAKDVQVEPVADDLATLTLDLLIAEEGYWRGGVNFMMLFGGNEQSTGDPPNTTGEH